MTAATTQRTEGGYEVRGLCPCGSLVYDHRGDHTYTRDAERVITSYPIVSCRECNGPRFAFAFPRFATITHALGAITVTPRDPATAPIAAGERVAVPAPDSWRAQSGTVHSLLFPSVALVIIDGDTIPTPIKIARLKRILHRA